MKQQKPPILKPEEKAMLKSMIGIWQAIHHKTELITEKKLQASLQRHFDIVRAELKTTQNTILGAKATQTKRLGASVDAEEVKTK